MRKRTLSIPIVAVLLTITASARSQDTQTEVVIVGTQHSITDMPDGYTPAHLRALLKKIRPAVLAVEAHSNAPDPWATAPFELWNVTKPWAVACEIPAIPCGWGEPTYQTQIEAMCQSFQQKGRGWAYQKAETEFQMESARLPLTCERMNSDAYLQIWRTYHAELHLLHGQATPWETWNDRIVKNVAELCAQYRGKRVAVVFGGAHAYYLTDQLAKVPGITVAPTSRFLPLTEDECRQQFQRQDHLKALRRLNFGAGALTPTDLIDLEKHLSQIADSPELRSDYRFFRAKFMLHRWDLEAALAEFEALRKTDATARLVFDNQSLVAESAAVFAASTQSQLGRQKEARANLEQIIRQKDVSEQTKTWAKQVLQSVPGK